MSDSSEKPITQWLVGLQAGDQEAARQLWERYFEQLVRLARKRLGNAPRRMADEEDVALSVFESLCNGMARGRFAEIADRDELWYLLLTITNQKVVSRIRHDGRKKRGGGDVRGDSVFTKRRQDGSGAGFDAIVRDRPTPEMLTAMDEQFQRLLDALRNDELRRVAVWQLEGYTTEEMAEKLGLNSRSIRRKLELIRKKWSKELDKE